MIDLHFGTQKGQISHYMSHFSLEICPEQEFIRSI